MLSPRGPYRFFATVHEQRAGLHDPACRVAERTLWRTAWHPEGPATLRAHLEAPDRLVVETWGPGAEAALESAPGVLGLDDDPSAFQPQHEGVARLLRKTPGVHLTRVPDLLRVLVQVILQQRVTWQEAVRSWCGLLRQYGAPAPGPEPELRLCPEPQVLAQLPLHAYAALGVEGRRAKAVVEVAIVHRRIAELASMSYADAAARLLAIPGVGPWTAGMTLGHGLGDPDAVVPGDAGLPQLVTWAFTGRPVKDDAAMLELLEPFRPHRFRVVRLLHESGLKAPRTAPGRRLGPLPGR